jgi:putative ABC transport system permease protein
VIAFRAFADSKLSGASPLTAGGLSNPVINRDERVLTVITVALVALAALNALFTTWAMVRDARRSSAVLQALGARAGQVSAGLVIAQVASALPGAILGVPLGLALFKITVHGGTTPPATWLAAVVLAVLAAVAALTVIPAAVSARHPVAPVLQAETA